MFDFDEINPISYIAALVAALVGFYMSKSMEGLGLMWKVLTPVACAIGGFLIMHKMSNN